MSNHPITPPPEMVRQWLDNDDFPCVTGTTELLAITKDRLNSVIAQAARWGADQELEACCGLIGSAYVRDRVRTTRRPKPPSLKVRIAEAIAKGDKHQALYLLDEALSDD